MLLVAQAADEVAAQSVKTKQDISMINLEKNPGLILAADLLEVSVA